MRKSILTAALTAVLFLTLPAGTSYATPSNDKATGTGTLGQFGNPTAHINAIAMNGLKGSFTITYPDGTSVAGELTCLAVSGNTAYVTGKITKSSGPRRDANNWPPGNYLVIGVQDNGEPGTAGPDKMNFSPGFATNPGCGPNGDAVPVFNIFAGNYTTFDS